MTKSEAAAKFPNLAEKINALSDSVWDAILEELDGDFRESEIEHFLDLLEGL